MFGFFIYQLVYQSYYLPRVVTLINQLINKKSKQTLCEINNLQKIKNKCLETNK